MYQKLLLLLTAAMGSWLWSCSSENNEPTLPDTFEATVTIEAPFDLTGYSAVFDYTPATKAATQPLAITVNASNSHTGTCKLPTLAKETVLNKVELSHPEQEALSYSFTGGQKLSTAITVTTYDKTNSLDASNSQEFTRKIEEIQRNERIYDELIVFGNMTMGQYSNISQIGHRYRTLRLVDQLILYTLSSDLLTKVTAPKATSVEDGTFETCASLATLDAPNLVQIGATAFRRTPITKINSKKLTQIGAEAFSECEELTSIDLTNATHIASGAFALCTKLTTVGSLAKAKTIEGAAFRESPMVVLDGKFDNLESVGLSAFANCLQLTQLKAPVLKTVGGAAFSNCPIVSADLPAVESVGRGAFEGTQISSLTLPNCLESQDGFQNMDWLKYLDLPKITKFTDTNSWGTTALTTLKFNHSGNITWPPSTGRIRLQNTEACALYLNAANMPSSSYSTFWGGHTWKSISLY